MRGFSALLRLEPFCGTGRILIPLAEMGHNLVGLDQSKGMLHQAQVKIDQLSRETQNKIQLIEADATTDEWPPGFDLVILAGNCFYELATPEEQETCIAKAGAALNPSGFVYVDNNHMEGELNKSWQNLGVVKKTLSGICADGSHVQCTMETVWYDVPSRLARFRRKVTIRYPDGHIIERESIQQKHPVSVGEVISWLDKYGFSINKLLGDRKGNPYKPSSERAVFWAKKKNL